MLTYFEILRRSKYPLRVYIYIYIRPSKLNFSSDTHGDTTHAKSKKCTHTVLGPGSFKIRSNLLSYKIPQPDMASSEMVDENGTGI